MVIVMQQGATDGDIDAVSERVRANGGEAFVSRGTVHTIIGLVGDTERFKAIDWRQMAGVDHVIQIFARILAVHPDASLVVLGDGPERPALERLVATLGLTSAVAFKGHGLRIDHAVTPVYPP